MGMGLVAVALGLEEVDEKDIHTEKQTCISRRYRMGRRTSSAKIVQHRQRGHALANQRILKNQMLSDKTGRHHVIFVDMLGSWMKTSIPVQSHGRPGYPATSLAPS